MARSATVFVLAMVLLAVLVGVALAAPSARVSIKSDGLYFPDQVEYIRAAHGKCDSEDLLYWPGDGRCYAEGSQGPCFFEFRLVWDARQLRPRCERDNSLFGNR